MISEEEKKEIIAEVTKNINHLLYIGFNNASRELTRAIDPEWEEKKKTMYGYQDNIFDVKTGKFNL